MTKVTFFTMNTMKTNYLALSFIILMASFLSFFSKVNASELSNKINSTSTAIAAHSVGQLTANKHASQKTTVAMSKKSPDTFGKTRIEHLLIKQKNKEARANFSSKQAFAKSSVTSNSINQSSIYREFSIYRAFSYLIDDIDGDEFYQTFSIVFDADVYHSAYAEVYAELYLRKDGGPWIHYYSSDIFSLYGESENDEFEVSTTLEQGFIEGYYDVLIDLYDAHSDELVVSYSSDESNALYALSLESSDYDQPYVTEVDVIYSHGGSLSLFMVMMIFALLLFRYKYFSPATI